MLDAILWLIVIEVIGLMAFPISHYLMPALRDRGYSVSKPLGLLIIGYTSWILSSTFQIPSIQPVLLILLAIFLGISIWIFLNDRNLIRECLARERIRFFTTEFVFLAVFVFWIIYRAHDPYIDTTEQPMDFAFLNAASQSTIGHPQDPWFSGESISYYYFGYWIMSIPGKLTAIPTAISYNLCLALIPAMAASGVFGLVSDLTQRGSSRLRPAFSAGLISVVLLIFSGNLEGVLEFMHVNSMGSDRIWEWLGIAGLEGSKTISSLLWIPDEYMWWWRATRTIGSYQGTQVVDYTIQEFPFFSFMLGDLHPHVMSIPFVVLLLTLFWAYLKNPSNEYPSGIKLKKNWSRDVAIILASGLGLGGLAFVNMWDFPVFVALAVWIAILKSSGQAMGLMGLTKRMAPFSLAVFTLAVVLISPYLISVGGNTNQIPVIAPVITYTTRPIHLLIVWGLYLTIVAPFVVISFKDIVADKNWRLIFKISMVITISPLIIWSFLYLNQDGDTSMIWERILHISPFVALLAASMCSSICFARKQRSLKSHTFVLALCTLSFFLIAGPELLYIDDLFDGATERMNTVFKLYYQAWILLSISSGYIICQMISFAFRLRGTKMLLARAWAFSFILLALCALYFPVAAIATQGFISVNRFSLDGLSHLLIHGEQSEYLAIDFLRTNAESDSVVLEAVGDDYSSFSRISSSTGIPTVLGWPGHQSQWGRNQNLIHQREIDVALIYQTSETEKAQSLMTKYHINYIYVGQRERQKYGEVGLGKFKKFMDAVFEDGPVTIYQIRK